MRTARYHDYVILKVIMFIALVGLGLFLVFTLVKPADHVAADDAWVTVDATCAEDGYRYKVCEECGEQFDRETILAKGHKLTYKEENHNKHTETEGESYETVAYCSECDYSESLEKVWVGDKHEVVIEETKENEVSPTCTKDGSYVLVKTCTGCDTEVSRETITLKATGHNYGDSWKAEYSAQTGKYSLVGTCNGTCGGTITTLTQGSSGVNINVKRDYGVSSCCAIRNIVSCTYEGKNVSATVDLPAEHNHSVAYNKDQDSYNPGEATIIPMEPKYDASTQRYYFDLGTSGVNILSGAEWDDNGFIKAIYTCYTCKQNECDKCNGSYTFMVFIYSAEKDTRITTP